MIPPRPMSAPQMAVPPGAPLLPQIGAPSSPVPAQPPGAMQGPPPVTIDAVMRLLRDNAHRRFRIDIEVDSTIAGDEAQERQDRIAFTEAVTKFIEVWGPITTQQPAMTKLAGELLLFNVRGFRTGRVLESVIEETVEKLEEMAGIPKGPPQPSPDELIKAKSAQAKGQAEVQKAQIDAQTARFEADARMQEVRIEAQSAAQDHAHSMQQGQMDAALADQQSRQQAAQNEMKAQLEVMRFQHAVEAANAPPKPSGGSK